jgi:hypothetical protein
VISKADIPPILGYLQGRLGISFTYFHISFALFQDITDIHWHPMHDIHRHPIHIDESERISRIISNQDIAHHIQPCHPRGYLATYLTGYRLRFYWEPANCRAATYLSCQTTETSTCTMQWINLSKSVCSYSLRRQAAGICQPKRRPDSGITAPARRPRPPARKLGEIRSCPTIPRHTRARRSPRPRSD